MIQRAFSPQTIRWPSDHVAAVFFALVAALTLAGAIYFFVRSLRFGDPLRGSLAVIAAGFTVAMAYEVFALWTGAPTISRVTNQAFQAHPVRWSVVYLVVMLATGALVIHFTRSVGAIHHNSNVPTAVGGLAALVIGMVLSWKSNWLP
jgi:hypothetical protein